MQLHKVALGLTLLSRLADYSVSTDLSCQGGVNLTTRATLHPRLNGAKMLD